MTIKDSAVESVSVSVLKYGPGLVGPVHDPEGVWAQMEDVLAMEDSDKLFHTTYSNTVLSARRVAEIVCDVLFDAEEVLEDGSDVLPEFMDQKINVEAVRGDYGFHKGRLEAYRAEIAAMILCLPPEFYRPEKSGDQWGLSFLLLTNDKDGKEWGTYPMAEQLFALAAGLGLAKMLLPQFMWGAAPGGLPFVAFANPETGELPRGFGE